MKRFLDGRSKRQGFDGWALKVKRARQPLDWSVCTTREEARQIKQEVFGQDSFIRDIEIVKVKIEVKKV